MSQSQCRRIPRRAQTNAASGGNLQQWPSDHPSGNWRGESPGGSGSTYDTAGSRTSPDAGLDGHIATADILNPSDALDLLAQVADLDPGRRGSASTRRTGKDRDADGTPSAIDRPVAYYPPLDDGVMDASEAAYLLKRYDGPVVGLRR